MNRSTKVMLAASAIGGTAAAALWAARAKPYSFEGKSVVITGGSRGLGLLIARQFAEEGARITLLARNGEALGRAAQELKDTGAQVLTIPCDVRDREQAEEAIETAVKHFGSIDVLVNNAGVITVGPLEEMELEDFQTAMATHAWGPLFTTLAALPHMQRQGAGRIVNISSIGGKIAVPHLVPYAMSKFALAGLSDGIRAEVRRKGIYVTSVYPGLMRTGSHVHAHTKGNSEAEYTWFSFMATNPLFAVSAKRAARQIVEACRKGRAELIVSAKARMAEAASGLMPGFVARMSALVNRFILPKPRRLKPAPTWRDRSDAPRFSRPEEAARSSVPSSSRAAQRPSKIV